MNDLRGRDVQRWWIFGSFNIQSVNVLYFKQNTHLSLVHKVSNAHYMNDEIRITQILHLRVLLCFSFWTAMERSLGSLRG
jgi:hypothetical protein